MNFVLLVLVVLLLLISFCNAQSQPLTTSIIDDSINDKSTVPVTDDDHIKMDAILRLLDKSCFERTEHGFWTYAYCKSLTSGAIRQYHAAGKRFSHLNAKQLFILGRRLTARAFSEKYFTLWYDEGSACSDDPKKTETRSSQVRFVCAPRLNNVALAALVEVVETRKCHYRLTIETPLLCKHRLFAAQRESTHATKASLADTNVVHSSQKQAAVAEAVNIIEPQRAPAGTTTVAPGGLKLNFNHAAAASGGAASKTLPIHRVRTIGWERNEEMPEGPDDGTPLDTLKFTFDSRRVRRGSTVVDNRKTWLQTIKSSLNL